MVGSYHLASCGSYHLAAPQRGAASLGHGELAPAPSAHPYRARANGRRRPGARRTALSTPSFWGHCRRAVEACAQGARGRRGNSSHLNLALAQFELFPNFCFCSISNLLVSSLLLSNFHLPFLRFANIAARRPTLSNSVAAPELLSNFFRTFGFGAFRTRTSGFPSARTLTRTLFLFQG